MQEEPTLLDKCSLPWHNQWCWHDFDKVRIDFEISTYIDRILGILLQVDSINERNACQSNCKRSF